MGASRVTPTTPCPKWNSPTPEKRESRRLEGMPQACQLRGACGASLRSTHQVQASEKPVPGAHGKPGLSHPGPTGPWAPLTARADL